MQSSYNVEEFKSAFEREYTYINGFMRNVFRKTNKPALFCPLTEQVWTYGSLNQAVNKLAHAFQNQGLQQGDVVMYALFNSIEFVSTYLATQKTGLVSAPINYRLSVGEIALLIENTQPKAFIYDAEFEKNISEALQLSHFKPQSVIMADLANEAMAPEGVVSYRDFVANMPTDEPSLTFVPNAYNETTRFFTSGTTNLPKAVPLSSINEILSAHDVMMHFPLNSADITMNLTPWFHRGGLHAGGPTPVLYAGGAMVMLRDFAPRLALQYVHRYQISFLIAVPTIIDMLCRLQESSPQDISSLRGLVLMGSPLDKAPCTTYLNKLTPNIFNGYGTTESFWNTFLRPSDLPEKAGSAGGPCTDDDVRVVAIKDSPADPYTEMVAQDNKTIGEVVILSVAKSACSYANNEEMTKKKFVNGWLFTGDLATWDEYGYITIIGRKDDMIVSSGENIYPVQVEAILNEHPKIAESLVLGLEDEKRGAIVVALIHPSDPSLTEQEIKQFCLEHPMLASYKRPRLYKFVDSLPHNATGKLVHKMPADIIW